MSIYRGAGGSGDAVADSSSEALLVRELAIEVQADADAAAASATAADASADAAAQSAADAVVTLSTSLLKANNLSDLTSVSTARTNLGLGTAALSATTDFDPAGTAVALAIALG